MPLELFNRDGHRCLMFHDLCDADGDAVQANQFLIVDGDTGAIIDPGGNLAYSELYLAMTRHFPPSKLTAILASHADPDIIASLDRWTTATQAQIYISTIWERFVPHFCKPGKTEGRVVGIPDAGMRIRVGRSELIALPAHFLHAEGNFQFYDPVSRILFSGDLGVSMLSSAAAGKPVSHLAEVLPRMEAFHRRYMVSNQVLRLWADMVAPLPIDMIVPQHGAPLAGAAVAEFIQWVRTLQCGVDLMGPQNYRMPV
ncbi:MAG: FprA family A-type flavoprotein [Burkholderiales bacterium]|nr:FprA family A-type flavoprotein [Burkholderiales bacterium]